ncbi:DNA cytosine methyltransferase [Bacillus megaterium]|nr:DNA cytosine methyltransferase [Priestia megaterium]
MEESSFTDESSNDAVSGVKNVLRDVAIPLEVASLFSGAGLMDLGFKKAGFTLKFALDYNEDATKTYAKNLGDHIVHEDIMKFNLKDMVKSAIMVLGSPCTALSNANRSKTRLKIILITLLSREQSKLLKQMKIVWFSAGRTYLKS